MIKVSVIIPVYNAEEYLGECLDSIINQTLEDIEIICIDDGSTDNSLNILNEYMSKDSRISVYSQENQGPSGARNYGMSFAKGKYVYFIDSDDYIDLEMLETLYNISEEKGTDIILFKLMNFNHETGEEYNTYYYDMPYLKRIVMDNVFDYKDIEDILFDIPVSVPGKFFKMEFVSQFKFHDRIKFEDNLFSVEAMIKAERMYFYDEYLYYRRIRDNSITTTFYNEYEDFIKMNKLLVDLVKDLGLFNEFKPQLYHKKLYNTYGQFHSIPYSEYKDGFFKASKADFLANKDEYESDDVFLSQIDERDRHIFYSCIESSTWKEFELKMEIFDEELKIKNLKSINEKSEKRIDELEELNSKQEREIDSLINKRNQILSSSSWKITEPLRKTKHILKNPKIAENSISIDKNKRNLLYVMHGGSGGTTNTNMDLMSYECEYYNCFLLVSNGHEMTLYFYDDSRLHEVQRWELNSKWVSENCYVEEYARIYNEILTTYSINLVHIRQLIHHTFDLPRIAKKLGIYVVLSFHDFYLVCLSHNLVDGDGRYCAGKCRDDVKCKAIMKLTNHEYINDFVGEWRSKVAEMFLNVDYFITTSQVVKELFLDIYPSIPEDRFDVIPHGRDFKHIDEVLYEKPSPNKPIKILFTGNINQPKGSSIIKELKELDADSRLELHFLGSAVGEVYNCGIHHGKYERNDLPRLIGEIKPSFIGIFSIWCETFCHTLTEAWAYGIPVLCTNLGAQGERMSKTNGGWFINPDNMQETYDMILNIANDRKDYLSKVENVKNISFKSIKEMGEDYLKVYRKFLD